MILLDLYVNYFAVHVYLVTTYSIGLKINHVKVNFKQYSVLIDKIIQNIWEKDKFLKNYI